MNNFGLSVDPVFPLWAVAAIALAAFTFFIWKEIKRSQRFLIWRITALTFMFVSLLSLMVRPYDQHEQVVNDRLLLTTGYDKSKVDSLLRINPSLEIVRTTDAESYRPNEAIINYQEVAESRNTWRFVAGQGLPLYAFDPIDTTGFDFIPAAPPTGVVQLFLPGHIHANQQNAIQGTFATHGKTILSLISPHGVEDSVILTGMSTLPFALSFTPKQAGRFVYSLMAREDGKIILKEKIPLDIQAKRQIHILFLQKFPTAETRYLKNYLAEQGHALALRYQTSQTQFNYEYANRPAMRIDRLSSNVVESFDLIFLDSKVLNELNEGEKNTLEKAIRDGLGAILLLDEIPKNGAIINRFLPIIASQALHDTVQVRLSDARLRTLPSLPLEISLRPDVHPITSSHDKILSGSFYLGAGKVGFQLLRETYRLQLEGNTANYASLWSPLIERTAKPLAELNKIRITTPFPHFTNEPMSIKVISSGAQPTLLADHTSLPLTEDVVVDDLWLGKTWAEEPGWHEFSVKGDSARMSYFVAAKGDWNTLRVANQLKENAIRAAGGPVTHNRSYLHYRPIPRLLFFLIFLFSAGFLWLAPKI